MLVLVLVLVQVLCRQILQHAHGRVASGSAHDAAALIRFWLMFGCDAGQRQGWRSKKQTWVSAAAAQVQALDGCGVAPALAHGTQEVELIQRHAPVEDVLGDPNERQNGVCFVCLFVGSNRTYTASEAKDTLEIKRAEHIAAHD